MTITRPTQLDLVLDKVIDDVERATVLSQHAVSAAEDLQRLLDVKLAAARVVHTYKGEGLTACGLEVVGPCPDCATANGERA